MHPAPKRISCLRCALVALLSIFMFLTGSAFADESPGMTRLDDVGLGISGQPAQAPD
ncbi:MAG: hypothetical protein GF310_12370, partial [candidate division Zixibacteria bacterium]|nr:hypothetical protein [candidate division Zixibacteria bacterium]